MAANSVLLFIAAALLFRSSLSRASLPQEQVNIDPAISCAIKQFALEYAAVIQPRVRFLLYFCS